MRSQFSRRDFLKISGGTAGLFATAGLFRGPIKGVEPKMVDTRPRWVKETTTICPFDASGCGFICYTDSAGNLTNMEGDPDNPVNRGSACSKGASLIQLHNNKHRLEKVLYRAAGANDWEEKSWDWAIGEIAKKVKTSRDNGFVAKNAAGKTVNRTEAIASLGGATLDNEECYLLSKMLRALGIVYLDSQARLSTASGMEALAASFGQNAMNNSWTDVSNANVILDMGGNPAENYPACFSHLGEAMGKGAELISVDCRLTRTAAKAGTFVAARSGSEIAFTGGLIKYVIADIEAHPANYNLTYITEYTTAGMVVNSNFKGPADLDGMFTGYNSASHSYDQSNWSFAKASNGEPVIDKTLTNPNCVFQLLKKQYARYTPEMVAATCGCSQADFAKVCASFAATGKADKAGAIIYAMSSTQHTSGAQTVRAYAILQMLLGNIGVSGGGLFALGGESNVQGAADNGVSWNKLPGYLSAPTEDDTNFAAFAAKSSEQNAASLLKAWYGSNASSSNGFGFSFLPKTDLNTNYSYVNAIKQMAAGKIKGAFAWGANPVVESSAAGQAIQALAKLDWLVVTDMFESETAAFWKKEGISSQTEVFLLPTACSYEKEGSVTNADRWVQWRNKAVNAVGEAKSELEIISSLLSRLQSLYQGESALNAEAVTKLSWTYSTNPSAADVAKEMNGYQVSSMQQIDSPEDLKSDGTVACGNNLYIGSFTDSGNKMARREQTGAFHAGWAWSWPMNVRILNNRASVDLSGQPFNAAKPVVSWNGMGWTGDAVDGKVGPVNQSGELPFKGTSGNTAQLFAAMVDGPMPEHYEPWESPVDNALSGTQNNPTAMIFEGDTKGSAGEYPVICTTIRTVEHSLGGQLTRNMPFLVELAPAAYVEISEQLASEKGIKAGDIVKLTSARGSVSVAAAVTKRLKPFSIGGKTVHQVAIPYHWGFMGIAQGDSANTLAPNTADSNSSTPEFKAFLVKVEKEADGTVPTITGRYTVLED